MFLDVLEIFKDCFEFAYASLDRIKILGDASVLDFLLVFFIASVFLPLFASTFGGRALASSGSSAVHGLIGRSKQDNQNKQNKQHKQNNHSKKGD